MSESKHTIKTKIINLLAEKKVENILKKRKLSEQEQRDLYIKTFNNLTMVLKDL